MKLAAVLDLLTRRLGVDPASLGSAAVHAAIEARLAASGLGSPERFAARLASDPDSLARLAEDILVPETWFFRGGDLFAHLARRLPRPFRALSLPCSTGEEPYSLAIAAAEAGLPASAAHIVGVDVSGRALASARSGLYGPLAFRQTVPERRSAWFRPAGGLWSLVPDIRRRVAFQHGNLLDPSLLGGEPPFDAVLCRNLFIYLVADARQRGLDALARLVKPGGLLVVGHAEPLPLGETRFTRDGPPELFLYRRAEAVAPARPAPPEPQQDPLVRARQDADAGRLDEAMRACREAEARAGPTAQTQALLGVLHQARLRPQDAARHFRRALNLDPSHREALAHLMLLTQQAGDWVEALALRGRLEKLGDGGES